VTWNPDNTPWDGYLEAVEQTAQGEDVFGGWSIGNRTGGVSRVDRVFMLRQGTQGRGSSSAAVTDVPVEVIAYRGVVTRTPRGGSVHDEPKAARKA
jgi:hypothetical protein